MYENTANFVFAHYSKEFFGLNDTSYNLIGEGIPIPFFDAEIITQLCHDMIENLKGVQMVPEIDGYTMIVGDIHGNFLDLVRIFNTALKLRPEVILFLGDYVDRGDFSVECLLLIFSFFLSYKEIKLVLLRGNHEFRSVNVKYGFKDSILSLYKGEDLWNLFNEVFDYLPISCILNHRFFCTHGGISHEVKSIDQIRAIERPLQIFENDEIVYPLMWADPGDNVGGHIESKRGDIAFTAGEASHFLSNNNLSVLIRGHEMVEKGVSHNSARNVITVFSTSNYGHGNSLNRCGFLLIPEKGNVVAKTLPFMYQLHLDNVNTKYIKNNLSCSNIGHMAIVGKSISPQNSFYTSPKTQSVESLGSARTRKKQTLLTPIFNQSQRNMGRRGSIRGTSSNYSIETFM